MSGTHLIRSTMCALLLFSPAIGFTGAHGFSTIQRGYPDIIAGRRMLAGYQLAVLVATLVNGALGMHSFNLIQQQCPEKVDPRIFSYGDHIPFGTPFRAFDSVPPGFTIKSSKIPGAGLGVFSTMFLRKHTWLGDYEGELLPKNNSIGLQQTGFHHLDYSWNIYDSNWLQIHHVDASDLGTSNWLRFINCPRHVTEENVGFGQCKEHIYYRTTRDLYPGVELTVHYGAKYARRLGVDVDNYYVLTAN